MSDDFAGGSSGVYVRSAAFLAVTEALSRGFKALLGDESHVEYAAPAVMRWDHLERCGYPQKFPQLVAAVAPLLEREDQDRLGLLPAACLPIYPLVSGLGPIGKGGLMVSTQSQCFRQEDAYSEVRLRAFTMAEWIFFGTPAQAAGFRDRLAARVVDWMRALNLPGGLRAANDPFYGRGREILIEAQLEQNLKLEMALSIANHGDVACFSFNHHGNFFCQRFDIVLADKAEPAHSACVGVGLERLALAMIDRHGGDIDRWPSSVRNGLELA